MTRARSEGFARLRLAARHGSLPRALPALLVTCEHAGNAVPARWAHCFARARAQALLRSHRGWDPGALELARGLTRVLGAPLVANTTTRLLADANRPPGHPDLFSRFTASLSADERRAILRAAHARHWSEVEHRVKGALARRRLVLHLSVHSFTPVLNGVARNCDVGLLYDPRRARERALCARWKALLEARAPELRVRSNYPYRGTSAALTTSLRRAFPADRYLGIELELNQATWARRGPAARRELAGVLADCLKAAR